MAVLGRERVEELQHDTRQLLETLQAKGLLVTAEEIERRYTPAPIVDITPSTLVMIDSLAMHERAHTPKVDVAVDRKRGIVLFDTPLTSLDVLLRYIHEPVQPSVGKERPWVAMNQGYAGQRKRKRARSGRKHV